MEGKMQEEAKEATTPRHLLISSIKSYISVCGGTHYLEEQIEKGTIEGEGRYY